MATQFFRRQSRDRAINRRNSTPLASRRMRKLKTFDANMRVFSPICEFCGRAIPHRKSYIQAMKRRTLISGLACLPIMAAGTPLFAQDNLLAEVSKYLNQLTSIKGQFTQINANGSRSGGEYYLHRPGLLRFDYSGSNALVLADGVNIGVLDPKSNQGAQKYPIGTTPLRFLLRRNIDLTANNLATGSSNKDGQTQVILRDPKKPRDGSMTLIFQSNPAKLLGWVVTEKNGQKTQVTLNSIERVANIPRQIFSIETAERQMR